LHRRVTSETFAVIDDAESQAVLEPAEKYLNFVRAGMLGDVSQRFLSHTVEGESDVGMDLPDIRKSGSDLEVLVLTELDAEGPQSGAQPNMRQDGRVKTMRHAANIIGKLYRSLLKVGDLGA
jgi:hypothetical protein